MPRRNWTENEDKAIVEIVQEVGTNWTKVATALKDKYNIVGRQALLRSPKQCRERFINHLNSDRNYEDWDIEEICTLFTCYRMYGRKWTAIAKELPGRTESDVKDKFYSTIRRNIRKMNRQSRKKISVAQILKCPELAEPFLTFDDLRETVKVEE